MKKLYSASDTVMAGYLQSVLESEGIDCWIKNLSLSGGIGELPPNECWPEIWLRHDRDYNRALAIVSAFVKPSGTSHSAWQCSCGEQLEGQFEVCWKCGASRPD